MWSICQWPTCHHHQRSKRKECILLCGTSHVRCNGKNELKEIYRKHYNLGKENKIDINEKKCPIFNVRGKNMKKDLDNPNIIGIKVCRQLTINTLELQLIQVVSLTYILIQLKNIYLAFLQVSKEMSSVEN